MKSQFYRSCTVIHPDTCKEFDAIFHRFEKESSLVMYTDEAGEPGSAVTSRIVGIVERTDGQILLVPPDCIRFIDRFAEKLVDRIKEKNFERRCENYVQED